MTRLGPLVTLLFVLLVIGTTLGTTFLWVIAGVSIVALIILIFAMKKADRFVGPKIIVDDAMDRIEEYVRDEHAEEKRAARQRQEDAAADAAAAAREQEK